MYQTRSLCSVYNMCTYIWIFFVIQVWMEIKYLKLLTIYDRPSNLSIRERITCFKLGLKICQEHAKIKDSSYREEF